MGRHLVGIYLGEVYIDGPYVREDSVVVRQRAFISFKLVYTGKKVCPFVAKRTKSAGGNDFAIIS